MRAIRFTTKSIQDTRRVARQFARTLARFLPLERACVLALRGELGAGKTTFMQGVAEAFGIKRFMTSPTFLLMRSFDIPKKRSAARVLIHVDSWRIEANDLEHLGMRETLRDPRALVCVEWADRVQSMLPRDTIWIDFKHVDRATRSITFRIP